MALGGTLNYIIGSIWKGGTATRDAKESITSLGDKTEDASLKMQLAKDASRAYGKAVRDVAKDLAAGKVSLEQAEQKLAEVRQELGRTEDASKTAGGSFTELKSKADLIGQGFGAAKEVVVQFYGILKEGAALEATQSKYEALATSIGSTGEAMLGDLRTATRGMVTDAELVAGAAELMSLKLTKTHDETVRLSTVAGQLDWDMQVLGLTLANQSTARLDALGLAIEDVVPRAKELEEQGLATDQAFKFAVIEAGEEKVQLLGEAADTTAGKLQRLEVATQNIGDRVKIAIADRWEPIIGGMVGVMDAVSEKQGQLNQAVEMGLLSREKANALLIDATFGLDYAQEAMAGYIAEVEAYMALMEEYLPQAESHDRVLIQNKESMVELDLAAEDLRNQFAGLETAEERLAFAAALAGDEHMEATVAMEDWLEAVRTADMQPLIEEFEGVTDAAGKAKEQIIATRDGLLSLPTDVNININTDRDRPKNWDVDDKIKPSNDAPDQGAVGFSMRGGGAGTGIGVNLGALAGGGLFQQNNYITTTDVSDLLAQLSSTERMAAIQQGMT